MSKLSKIMSLILVGMMFIGGCANQKNVDSTVNSASSGKMESQAVTATVTEKTDKTQKTETNNSANNTDKTSQATTMNITETEKNTAANPQTGNFPPALTATNLQGNTVNLSDYKGKVVLVVFSTPWCHACQDEMFVLEDFWQDYKDREEFAMMSVSLIDNKEYTLESVKDTHATNGFTFPATVADQTTVKNAYGLKEIPTIMFVNKQGEWVELSKDKDGNPQYLHIGAMDKNELKTVVDNLLNK